MLPAVNVSRPEMLAGVESVSPLVSFIVTAANGTTPAVPEAVPLRVWPPVPSNVKVPLDENVPLSVKLPDRLRFVVASDEVDDWMVRLFAMERLLPAVTLPVVLLMTTFGKGF